MRDISVKESIQYSLGDDNSSTYLATSPNGVLAATFNSVNSEIKIYFEVNNKDNLTTPDNSMKMDEYNLKSKKVYFSLAISDPVNTENDAFVAVSRFCLISRKENPTETFVLFISKDKHERIESTVDNRGGVIRFLKNDSVKKADQSNELPKCDVLEIKNEVLILMNASGITKALITNSSKPNRSIFKSTSMIVENYLSNLVAKEYEFPTIIKVKLDKLYHDSTCTRFLNTIIERKYLFVEDYKNQILEMYNLQSMNLELTFKQRDQVAISTKVHGNAIFSISKRGHLLAYCNGTKSITIYLMENGLEITTKEFTDAMKILSISFIDDDERLFVVTENVTEESSEEAPEETIEEGTEEASEEASEEGTEDTIEAFTKEAEAYDETITPKIYIWDLFTFKNDVQMFDDNSKILSSLRKSNIHSIACSSGTILVSLPEENICCGLSYVKSKLKQINISPINLEGSDAKKEQKGPFFVNREPWVRRDKSRHKPYYLDESKTIQLIIGETTVQVWKEKKGHGSKNKRVFKYIWVFVGKQKIQVKSLKIGNCEFSLDLLCIEKNEVKKIKENIHWPNKAHVLKDARVAIEYLYERRYEPAGSNNLNKFSELFIGIEKLIKKCIKKNPGLWSLSEVRYGIMANIIRSKHVPLLHWILFDYEADSKKQVKTRVSRNLHIPSQYEWTMEMKISDLMIAINQTLGENRRDKSIVAMLLEYYSNNAEEDTGWMFTVTESLSSLKKDHFESYLKELFYKPCFGSKEELVDSKFVSQKTDKRNTQSTDTTDKKSTGATDKKITQLTDTKYEKITGATGKKNTQSTDSKDEKSTGATDKNVTRLTTVRVVPLPNFTVYPTNATDRTHNNWMIPLKLIKLIFLPRRYMVHDKDHFSPFLELISKNENEQLYDNPAMEACIDFKWGAARNHFLQNFVKFIAFSFTFVLFTGINKDFAYSKVLFSLFFYIGYHLLATEFVQSRHEGLKRYFNIYNILDVVSVILAIITMINYISEFIFEEKAIILKSFAILLLWLELHVILVKPELIDLKPSGNKFMVVNSKNPDFEGLTFEQVFDLNDPMDNYYRKLTYSVIGSYFWILGRWDQLEKWDFWPIYVISIGASILIVIIMQNLLIAFMTGVYENARKNVKLAVLGYRADLVADYETLEKLLGSSRGNPRYIYYVGSVEYQEEWLQKAKKLHKSLLIEDINCQLSKCPKVSDDSDDSDDDQDEKILNVANKGKNDQKIKLNSSGHEDNTNITNDEKFLKLQDEMMMLQNDVKELLSIAKSKDV
ncbi:8729_t:CDS:2 [Funneliformis geosporum]|nr:8729_t:CDS:2 [Funneliformis geosporum]